MIGFTGKTTLFQYVPGKPHPHGLKNIVLAGTSGIVYDCGLYQGETTWADKKPLIGIGRNAVLHLCRDYQFPNACLYVDHYFTCEKLLEDLLAKGTYATRTLMSNGIPCQLESTLSTDRAMCLLPRGNHVQFTRADNIMCCVKWCEPKRRLFSSLSLHAVV